MKKTDKKIDKAIVKVLTEVCEVSLKQFDGFEWLTHLVNYNDFPASLRVVCVFETNEQLSNANQEELCELVNHALGTISIKLHKPISFDTEENCAKEHKGNWNKRFNQ